MPSNEIKRVDWGLVQDRDRWHREVHAEHDSLNALTLAAPVPGWLGMDWFDWQALQHDFWRVVSPVWRDLGTPEMLRQLERFYR